MATSLNLNLCMYYVLNPIFEAVPSLPSNFQSCWYTDMANHTNVLSHISSMLHG